MKPNRIPTISLLAVLLLLLGAGAASAAEITVGVPETPLTVGETTTIPLTITGADNLVSLSLQVRSSDSAALDENQNPLDGIYAINPANGKILWLSTEPFTGDGTMAVLIVTPASAEDIPVDLTLTEAYARGSDTNIADQITVKSAIIPVAGSQTVAEVAPTRTYVPTGTATKQPVTASPTSVSTPAATTVKATGSATVATTPAATTVKTTGSTAIATTPVPTGTTESAVTQASLGYLPFIGLLGGIGFVLRFRRE